MALTKIAVIHDWLSDIEQEITWKDGLAAAIRILSQKYELKFYTFGKSTFTLPHEYFPIHFFSDDEEFKKDIKAFSPDVILHWADSTRPHASIGRELGIPQAICFAGGEPFEKQWQNFDHFFVESDEYKEKFEKAGCSVSTAFGTNTELFRPNYGKKKVFDICFPATYADWKRHRLFAKIVEQGEYSAVTAGFKYKDHEQWCYELPEKAGALVLGHVSGSALVDIYNQSRVCLITSANNGGSQRTVLEAMACNIPVVVMSDSRKCSEYINRTERFTGLVADLSDFNSIINAVDSCMNIGESDARTYILEQWSEFTYAAALETGLCKLLASS
mgnify:CR=1 FL=1